jgi:hypothetical protein
MLQCGQQKVVSSYSYSEIRMLDGSCDSVTESLFLEAPRSEPSLSYNKKTQKMPLSQKRSADFSESPRKEVFERVRFKLVY